MADFRFLKNMVSKQWVVSAPRRAKRPNIGQGSVQLCPFCVGQEKREQEVYRVGGKTGDSNWHIRVLKNHFPFARIHELIIHSPDHHKNFDELPFSQVELILQTYRQRYNVHKDAGQVYIFHNRGIGGGESLPHPHTQLVVVPKEVNMEISPLDTSIYRIESGMRNQESWEKHKKESLIHNSLFLIQKTQSKTIGSPQIPRNDVLCTDHFFIFCPDTSEWPDEVWIAPKKNGKGFGAITADQISDLGFCLSRLIQILDIRHGHEFPFNFYIYPGNQWYLRIIPRIKILGGFEVGTHIIVNTQDPKETFAFIKEHFWEPDIEKIRGEHQAEYWRAV